MTLSKNTVEALFYIFEKPIALQYANVEPVCGVGYRVPEAWVSRFGIAQWRRNELNGKLNKAFIHFVPKFLAYWKIFQSGCAYC